MISITAWSGFLSVELKSQVNSFLKRAFKYGFCSRLYIIEVIADDADIDLFCKMTKSPSLCSFSVPAVKSDAHNLRPKGHTYELPRCDTEMYKNSFVPRCLYQYV